jgi:hypothetical protein
MTHVTKNGLSARTRPLSPLALTAAALCALVGLAGCGGSNDSGSSVGNGLPTAKATQGQVAHGRVLFTTFGCVDCHSQGKNDPTSATWMAGYLKGGHQGVFQIGPFTTYAANLTPDAATGLGNMTDQQIYNALKYGLDPGATPDAAITGTTPWQGNFPAQPHYLAPPMPWTSTRHMSDDDLWALVAYVKHGVKAVSNAIPDIQGPPDFWASSYTPDKVGPYPLPAYPAASEQFSP